MANLDLSVNVRIVVLILVELFVSTYKYWY